MQQLPYLTVRGRPVACVYQYAGVVHVEFAQWEHKLKKGLGRKAVIDWAMEKYATTGIDIERLDKQLKATLAENEDAALVKAIGIKTLE